MTSDSYYPAHASHPVRVHGASDLPRRVHEAEPDEDITGLDIWDNDERPAIEQWREWFLESGAAASWATVDCIECELGRRCPRGCVGVCGNCGHLECVCAQ